MLITLQTTMFGILLGFYAIDQLKLSFNHFTDQNVCERNELGLQLTIILVIEYSDDKSEQKNFEHSANFSLTKFFFYNVIYI